MVGRLKPKWLAVRVTFLPWPSYQWITLSLRLPSGDSAASACRGSAERVTSLRASAACFGNRRASVGPPGMIEPYVCIGTPYRPRLIHSGVKHLSERAPFRGVLRDVLIWTNVQVA